MLVWFLGEIFGPLGYVMGVAKGEVSAAFGWTLPTNDLLWWIPFGMMLYYAWKAHETAAGSRRGVMKTVMERCPRRGSRGGSPAGGRALPRDRRAFGN